MRWDGRVTRSASGGLGGREWGLRRWLGAVTGVLVATGLSATSPAAAAQVDPITDPRPVLLVPGWGDGPEELEPLKERFLESGWDSLEVLPVGFEDPVGSNERHAREIGKAARELRERTGAERIDVVAHSMGGLAVRAWLLKEGAEHTRRVVFLATPHEGTYAAHLAWGEGAEEMLPRSPFILGLRRGEPVPRGVRAITVRTPLDLHILPNESATLPGLPNLEVCCPTHAGLLDHDGTFQIIERFLESRLQELGR